SHGKQADPTTRRVRSSLQHGRSSGSVEGKHGHAEFRSLLNRLADSIGDVVELEIQEYLVARSNQLPHESRPFSGEKLQSHFEQVCSVTNLLHQVVRLCGAGYVQSNNQPLTCAGAGGCHRPV